MKGQGFVPVNKTLKKVDYNKVEISELQKLFTVEPGIEYRIFDTAGMNLLLIFFIYIFFLYF